MDIRVSVPHLLY